MSAEAVIFDSSYFDFPTSEWSDEFVCELDNLPSEITVTAQVANNQATLKRKNSVTPDGVEGLADLQAPNVTPPPQIRARNQPRRLAAENRPAARNLMTPTPAIVTGNLSLG
jgi:hypothetical protein